MITGTRHFMARLARVEAAAGSPRFPQGVVVWDDDEVPADCRPVIRLSRKAPSAEAWAQQVREDHPEWFPGACRS